LAILVIRNGFGLTMKLLEKQTMQVEMGREHGRHPLLTQVLVNNALM
jgi:hypothetical protein